MKLRVILAAKLKDKSYELLVNEYVKRISSFGDAELVEIPESNDSSGNMSQKCMLKIQKSAEGFFTVPLVVTGKSYSSKEFASWLQNRAELYGKIAFIVGASCGLPNTLTDDADELISLSKLTLAHRLAALVIFEQIYRALTINANHPYHK